MTTWQVHWWHFHILIGGWSDILCWGIKKFSMQISESSLHRFQYVPTWQRQWFHLFHNWQSPILLQGVASKAESVWSSLLASSHREGQPLPTFSSMTLIHKLDDSYSEVASQKHTTQAAKPITKRSGETKITGTCWQQPISSSFSYWVSTTDET